MRARVCFICKEHPWENVRQTGDKDHCTCQESCRTRENGVLNGGVYFFGALNFFFTMCSIPKYNSNDTNRRRK